MATVDESSGLEIRPTDNSARVEDGDFYPDNQEPFAVDENGLRVEDGEDDG